MILKIKYDDDENPTELRDIVGINIDEDQEYAITDEDEDPYFEIEREGFTIYRHTMITDEEGETSYTSTDRKYLLIEILTDKLVLIQKWERPLE